MEAVFCILAHRVVDEKAWRALNATASAMRPARESREASLKLGRRLLSLAASLQPDRRLHFAGEVHLATAFGLIGSVLGLEAADAAGGYLHQSLFGAVSACQRLLPLGQTQAMQMLWQMKPAMATTIRQACSKPEISTFWSLQPMLEIASMRHPLLPTRLFIS